MVEIGTRSRIPNWLTFVFLNQKSLRKIGICWPLMSTKFGLLIDFGHLKANTSTNMIPEVVLSDRGRHLEKSIWHHISAVADPEWYDNNGDEVKIETEKSDGLKARNFWLVVQACKSRMQEAAFWTGLFDMALKNLGFYFFKPKKPKKSEFRFFRFLKKWKPNVRFKLLFTCYATNLIEMLSNFPINMNCIFAFTWPNLCSQLFYGHTYIFVCGTV